MIAARQASTGLIIVTGLAADAAKLELARTFGAHHIIVVDRHNPVSRVRELTDSGLADVVLDVSAYATQPATDAHRMVKLNGTVVLVGLKVNRPIPDLMSGQALMRGITITNMLKHAQNQRIYPNSHVSGM